MEHGDSQVAHSGEILRTVVGSGVHGIAIEGTDDHDEMGIYIEPAHWVLGFQDRRDNYIWRTQGEGERSGPGDIDLVMYSLRKFLQLAVKGNPTVLIPLFAPEDAILSINEFGEELRQMRKVFLSKEAGHRFLGYMHGQHQRMLGQEKRNVPNRPELIEKYGFDVKYASHALRLAMQGNQIITTGDLTLPMREDQRELVLQVKRGEVPKEIVSKLIWSFETATQSILDTGEGPLPDKPPVAAITAWAVSAQQRFWSKTSDDFEQANDGPQDQEDGQQN